MNKETSGGNYLSASVNSAVPPRGPVAPPPPPKVIRPTERSNEENLASVSQPEVHACTHVPESADVHARITQKTTGKRTSTKSVGEFNVDTLYEQLRDKRHLSTSTFRYKAEELQELENIYGELNQEKPGRMSRNDMARLALIYLCEDYRNNGETSILEQMLKRM